jgi:hypothetical protein
LLDLFDAADDLRKLPVSGAGAKCKKILTPFWRTVARLGRIKYAISHAGYNGDMIFCTQQLKKQRMVR